MREFRKGKNCTEHYTSFSEAAKAFGCREVVKRTKDENKLAMQREKFLGICKVCKQPLHLVSGCNVLSCTNPDCRGVKMTGTNEDGSTYEWYIPVNRVLDSKGAEIARNLFD